MAGYIFTLSKPEAVFDTIARGSYSTIMSEKWSVATEGTLGDFITMKPGDSVYFFSKRKVYGIGELVEVMPGQTVVENYPGATSVSVVGDDLISATALEDDSFAYSKSGDRTVKRWVIVFKPSPFFFSDGLDMDDLLTSNPRAFRSLRVFWKRSFIKFDDEEDLAFKTAILRRNAAVLADSSSHNTLHSDGDTTLERIRRRIGSSDRSLKVEALLADNRKEDASVGTEMQLELGLLSQLTHRDPETVDVFGSWDYLSHQVHASPAKAVDYMDKIDLFGYRWLPGYKPIIGGYLVAELKKDTAKGEDLHQIMKYVDWVRDQHCNGDYSLISAFLVARSFDLDSVQRQYPTTARSFIASQHPAQTAIWNRLRLISYQLDAAGHLTFSEVFIGDR